MLKIQETKRLNNFNEIKNIFLLAKLIIIKISLLIFCNISNVIIKIIKIDFS